MSTRFPDSQPQELEEDTLPTLIGRINVILLQRFGCQIRFKSISEFVLDDFENFTELRDGMTFQQRSDLIIPVRHEDTSVAGYVTVIDGAGLTAPSQQRVMNLLDCTLIEMVKKSEELRKLRGIERVFASSEWNANVLPFKSPRQTFENTMTRPKLVPRWNMVRRRPILLRGQNNEIIHRVALEIYESLKSMAFIPFKDLTSRDLDHFNQWRELGPVVIFIEDVAALDAQQIENLTQLTRLGSSANSPQIVAGHCELTSALPFADLDSARNAFSAVFRCPAVNTEAAVLSELVELFLYSDPLAPSPHSPLTH
jgi:hypothetical protein